MQSGEELVEKQFQTRRDAFSYMLFISSFDVNEVLLRREGDIWSVKYRANRSVVYLKEDDFSLVA